MAKDFSISVGNNILKIGGTSYQVSSISSVRVKQDSLIAFFLFGGALVFFGFAASSVWVGIFGLVVCAAGFSLMSNPQGVLVMVTNGQEIAALKGPVVELEKAKSTIEASIEARA